VSDVSNQVTSPIRPTSEQNAPASRSPQEILPAVRRATASVVTSAYLPWTLVGLGVLVRLVRYAADRSLWLDESYLVLNLKSRSYGQLLQTLDFNQAAPPGFLFIEKTVLNALGDSEYALRLFPFAASIAAMVLAYPVARRYLSRQAVPVALFLFAVLEPFTYFATEVKQYSSDILITLVLLYVFARVLDAEPGKSTRWIAALAVTGAVGVWFSYPSVFIVAGTGGALLVRAIRQRDRTSIMWVVGSYGVFLIGFALVYFLSIHRSSGVEASAVSSTGSKSVVKNLYLIFADPAELPRTVVGLAAVLTFIGAVSIFRRRAERALMMAASVAIVLLAGLAGNYPIGQRFLAFLLPLVVLGLAEGIVALTVVRSPVALAAAFALAVLVLAPPGLKAAERTAQPPKSEEIAPLLGYVETHWQSGDTLYLSARAQYAFRYYMECNDCSGNVRAVGRRLWPYTPTAGHDQTSPAIMPRTSALVLGTSYRHQLKDYPADVNRLRGRGRVWVLFTHNFPFDLKTLTSPFQRNGKQLDERADGIAAVFLYDFAS